MRMYGSDRVVDSDCILYDRLSWTLNVAIFAYFLRITPMPKLRGNFSATLASLHATASHDVSLELPFFTGRHVPELKSQPVRPRPSSLRVAVTMSTEAGPSTAHEIRITNHGKIKNWVTVALEHLQVRVESTWSQKLADESLDSTEVRGQTVDSAHAAYKEGQGTRH